MIVEILFGFLAVVAVFALFLLQADPSENENAAGAGSTDAAARKKLWTRLRQYALDLNAKHKQPVVSKDVILAMAQKRIYKLKDTVDETECTVDESGQWARELIASSCEKLDAYRLNVMSLEMVIINFCKRIDKIIDTYEEKICEYNHKLALFTKARLALEEEVYRIPFNEDIEQNSDLISNNKKCRAHLQNITLPASMSNRCDFAISTNDDDLLSVFDQFVDENIL